MAGPSVEVVNVNQGVSKNIACPRSEYPYAEVVGSETYSFLPAFLRNQVPAGDCGIAHEIDEDRGSVDFLPFPQKAQMCQPIGILMEALRPVLT